MCFSSSLLEEIPHDAASLVEDLEYGIRLGEAGYRVRYAAEAHVYGAPVTGAKAAVSQRRRWEGGHWRWLSAAGRSCPREHLSSAMAFSLALDLLVPPLTWIILLDAGGLVGAAWLAIASGAAKLSLLAWSASVFFAAAYVLRGRGR